MTQDRNRPRRRILTMSLLGVLGLPLTACFPGPPPPTIYVLGAPARAVDNVEPIVGRPVVQVKPVLVPDYLDVSDILSRQSDNVVVASRTGRWGERLSEGVTRALTFVLAQRLPKFTFTTTQPVRQPARQLLVDVETFEPRADGTVVLIARWRVLDGAGRNIRAGERVSLTEQVAGTGDAAVVAAMTRAIEALGARIAQKV